MRSAATSQLTQPIQWFSRVAGRSGQWPGSSQEGPTGQMVRLPRGLGTPPGRNACRQGLGGPDIMSPPRQFCRSDDIVRARLRWRPRYGRDPDQWSDRGAPALGTRPDRRAARRHSRSSRTHGAVMMVLSRFDGGGDRRVQSLAHATARLMNLARMRGELDVAPSISWTSASSTKAKSPLRRIEEQRQKQFISPIAGR